MRLQGKVAIITGTAGGIGRATAIKFAVEGAVIVGGDISTGGNEETRDIVEHNGGKMIIDTVDVTDNASVGALFARAESEFGHVHIVFNNAGVMLPDDGDVFDTSDETIDATLAINVKGVLIGCRHAIPALRRAGGGSIINTASFVASVGAATPQIAYTASKGAVLALTRELAVVHAKENIRVNALSPGPLRTEMLMRFLDTEEKRNRRLVHVPMGRFGEAAEMANVAAFLASDEASYVTGANMLVDGGLTAAYVTPE